MAVSAPDAEPYVEIDLLQDGTGYVVDAWTLPTASGHAKRVDSAAIRANAGWDRLTAALAVCSHHGRVNHIEFGKLNGELTAFRELAWSLHGLWYNCRPPREGELRDRGGAWVLKLLK